MARKKSSSRRNGKLDRDQLLEVIVKETSKGKGKAVYEFYPGAKKMDFIELYCDGFINPGGTNKAGWRATPAGTKYITG